MIYQLLIYARHVGRTETLRKLLESFLPNLTVLEIKKIGEKGGRVFVVRRHE